MPSNPSGHPFSVQVMNQFCRDYSSKRAAGSIHTKLKTARACCYAGVLPVSLHNLSLLKTLRDKYTQQEAVTRSREEEMCQCKCVRQLPLLLQGGEGKLLLQSVKYSSVSASLLLEKPLLALTDRREERKRRGQLREPLKREEETTTHAQTSNHALQPGLASQTRKSYADQGN